MIFRRNFRRLKYHYPISTNCPLGQYNFMPHVYLKSEPNKITEMSGDKQAMVDIVSKQETINVR